MTIAQKSIKLSCIGNKAITTSKYQSWISEELVNPVDTSVVRNIKQILSQKLLNGSYHHFKFKSIVLDSSNADYFFITLSINEGNRSFVRKVKLNGAEEKDSIFITEKFQSLLEKPFIEQELETKIEEVLQYYENNGYPFINISIHSVVFEKGNDKNYADIYLNIDKNKLSTIDQIQINGNTKTKNYIIINTLRFKKGELYSQEKINEIPNQLNKLRFFSQVNQPVYSVNSGGEGILEITLSEKNTNSFDGILGYIPGRDEKEEGYLTGFVNISLRNLFGTGRSAAFRWQKENSSTQELEIKYLEPWIFNYPFNLTLEFLQRKQDTSYIKRAYMGSIEFLATENISASLILESESIIPSINKNANITILNSSSLNSGLQFKVDYRDDIYAPTSGLYFVSTYKFKSKTISDANSNLNYHNYELDFGGYYSFFKSQVLALGLHVKEIIGDTFELSDFYQFGGANTLRGYRENQFLGNRILWSNLEYRFMLSRNSYIFGFYDLGYFMINKNSATNSNRTSEYKHGYGLGLSLETALGIMKISYAFAEGTSLTNGLIHFGLVNEF